MKINIIILFVLCMLLGVSAGCRGTKTVMRFTDNNTLNCYPTRAPFSNEPNFYCTLKIPAIAFNSGIIDLFMFKSFDGYWGFIFENWERKIVLITSVSREPQYIRYNTPVEFIRSLHNPVELHQLTFEILDQRIDLYDVECVRFRWDSGGVTYFGFNKFEDGFASIFRTGYYRETMDKSNSGRVYFRKWEKWKPRFMQDWPTIDRIETFDKPNE